MEWGREIVECKVLSVWSVECGNVESKVWSGKWEVGIVGCIVWSVWSVKCGVVIVDCEA